MNKKEIKKILKYIAIFFIVLIVLIVLNVKERLYNAVFVEYSGYEGQGLSAVILTFAIWIKWVLLGWLVLELSLLLYKLNRNKAVSRTKKVKIFVAVVLLLATPYAIVSGRMHNPNLADLYYKLNGYKIEYRNDDFENTKIVYDKKGNKIEESFYDEKGNLEAKIGMEGAPKSPAVFLFKYDNENRITEERFFAKNGLLIRFNNYAIIQYEYDDRGNKIRESFFDDHHRLDKSNIFKFDENNNKIEESSYNEKGELIHRATRYKYDVKGRLIEKGYYDKDGKLTEEYGGFGSERSNAYKRYEYNNKEYEKRVTKYINCRKDGTANNVANEDYISPFGYSTEQKVPEVSEDDILTDYPSALVTIVLFADFQSLADDRPKDLINKIVDTYGDKVRIAVKHISNDQETLSVGMDKIANCTNKQGLTNERYEKLSALSSVNSTISHVEQWATELGLNAGKFYNCLGISAYLSNSYKRNKMEVAGTIECAKEQGIFWEVYDKIIENNKHSDQPTLSQVKQWISNLNSDIGKFSGCLISDKYKNKVENDIDQVQEFSIENTTPFFFFINKHYFTEKDLNNFDIIKTVIDGEIDCRKKLD